MTHGEKWLAAGVVAAAIAVVGWTVYQKDKSTPKTLTTALTPGNSTLTGLPAGSTLILTLPAGAVVAVALNGTPVNASASGTVSVSLPTSPGVITATWADLTAGVQTAQISYGP